MIKNKQTSIGQLSIGYVVFLCLAFASLGQASSDMYLPSLPAIHVALQTSVHLVQATVFTFMLGYAISRFIYGPLSDAIGRKKPLILGLTICWLGVLLCVLTKNIAGLLLGRFLQGLGIASGIVITGAMIRDLAEPKRLSYIFSFTTLTNIVVIASAPFLGGYFQHYFGWRSNFIFLLIYTSFSLFFSIFVIKETNQHQDINHIRPMMILKNFMMLVKDQGFFSYGSCLFLTYAGLLAWLTLGPILMQKQLGLTPIQFGWLALTLGGFYAVGAVINSQLVKHFDINTLLKMGFLIQLLGGILMMIGALLGFVEFWIVIVPVILFMTMAAITFTNAYAGAMFPFPAMAGMSMAVLGFGQTLGGAVSSGIISALPDDNQLPMAVIFVICSMLGYWLIRRLSLSNKVS